VAFKIGIDVGGTFTDLFLWSPETGAETFKVLSTPEDPSEGVMNGLAAMAEARDLTVDEFARRIHTIVHGTTVTTNAVLTRAGACTGLLTTDGVRDALEMRRGIREEQYNNKYRNVVPLVPRYLRRPVHGRLDYQGREIAPLAVEEIRQAARIFRKEGVEAVAICFMNSFANPDHEAAAREAIQEEMPDAYLSVSSEVLPTIRFYNRVSTTVLNAFVGPVLGDYLRSLTSKLEEIRFEGVLLIMQSSGGVALPEFTLRKPATTLLSGPAAGPRAAGAISAAHGANDCILVDMGGTSFDASVVRDGQAELATEGEIDRLKIALPMMDITTIGAGGGSIGWIDAGGLLRMGPQSAGALPGPACYGRGGELPTCTDADLTLGFLAPEYFAGGKLPLDPDRARAAIREKIAGPLGLDVDEAAAGMYRVINANMAHGVREITIARGLDPREFPLVVAGGAGALHACMIANELEIPTLLFPATASILCAAGMALSDLQQEFVRSYIAPFATIDAGRLRDLVNELVDEGERQLRIEGIPDDRIEHRLALDLRYLKQYHEVTLPVSRDAIERGDTVEMAKGFHAEHNRLYGYDLAEEGTDLQLINVRVRSIGRTDKPDLPRIAQGTADPGHALKGERRAFLPERAAFEEVPVFDGHLLLAGNSIAGPALIERTDTTLFITGSFSARVDDHGTCVLERER